MTIDQNTSQEKLEKLYRTIVRQEFLRGTPLNIKPFLRYSLLFLLFPGMVFGFWIGLGLTGAFCAVLLAFLLTDHASWGMAATCTWLCLGLIPAVFITWDTFRRARHTRNQRLMMRQPLRNCPPATCLPSCQHLQWHKQRSKHGQRMVSSIHIPIPSDGVYAFLLTIENYSGARLATDGPMGVCLVESAGKPGETLNALLLYRLKKGQHKLAWAIAHSSEPPKAAISLLNR